MGEVFGLTAVVLIPNFQPECDGEVIRFLFYEKDADYHFVGFGFLRLFALQFGAGYKAVGAAHDSGHGGRQGAGVWSGTIGGRGEYHAGGGLGIAVLGAGQWRL
jgi:hypothetical protein